MPNFTPTTNAAAIPTVVAAEVIRLLPSYMGLAKFVSKDTDWTGSDFQTYGNTLDIVKPGNLTVQDKVPGTPISTQSATATKVSVTLNKHKYISILQEDITKMLQKPDLQMEYAKRMAIKLAEQVESDVFAVHPSINNVVTWNRASADTVEASFLAVREKFARLKVAQAETKGIFFDTSIITDLLKNTKYSSGDYVNAKTVPEGAVRRIYNMDIYESQLVPLTGSPGAYHNLALTPYGIVLASRPMPLDGNGRGAMQTVITDPATGLAFRTTESYDSSELGVKFTMDLLYGVAIADDQQIIEIEST